MKKNILLLITTIIGILLNLLTLSQKVPSLYIQSWIVKMQCYTNERKINIHNCIMYMCLSVSARKNINFYSMDNFVFHTTDFQITYVIR